MVVAAEDGLLNFLLLAKPSCVKHLVVLCCEMLACQCVKPHEPHVPVMIKDRLIM